MDIKTPYSKSTAHPREKQDAGKGTVADSFKMGLEDEDGNLMHDSFWNGFVTLLSALSPGHFRLC